MARIVVPGTGISGHTAAQIVKRKPNENHKVAVVSPPGRTWPGRSLDKTRIAFNVQPKTKVLPFWWMIPE